MKTYVDTSVLFSLYATDANSVRADAWRKNNSGPLPFSVFHRLELHNALCLAAFQKRFTVEQAQLIWKDIETDIQSGLLGTRGGLWHRILLEAESACVAHTANIGCRTLDVIHVAAAKMMGMTEFCTFDPRQSAIAAKLGLSVMSI